MGDSKLTRLRAKLLRRSSTSSAKAESSPYNDSAGIDPKRSASNFSVSPTQTNTEERQRKGSDASKKQMSKQSIPPPKTKRPPSSIKIPVNNPEAINTAPSPPDQSPTSLPSSPPGQPGCPKVTLEGPTPELLSREATSYDIKEALGDTTDAPPEKDAKLESPTNPTSQSQRPPIAQRRQSLLPYSQTRLIKTLLESERPQHTSRSGHTDYFSGALPSIQADMLHRKIWVKRPGASPTLVSIHEDDVVDDVRDAILKKYANSLGRSFDAPDLTLRIVTRDHSGRSGPAERVLGPEEPIGRTLDAYFPGGQMLEDALIIDVPHKRTPKASPRPGHHMPYYFAENIAPGEGGEYFPPMPAVPSPHFPGGHASSSSGQPSHHPSIHSMSVLTTGQLPPLPSPGQRGGNRHQRRPNNPRQHTSSPTILTTSSPSATSAGKYHSNICPLVELMSVLQTASSQPLTASRRFPLHRPYRPHQHHTSTLRILIKLPPLLLVALPLGPHRLSQREPKRLDLLMNSHMQVFHPVSSIAPFPLLMSSSSKTTSST
jgi:osomolarity two-component system response regulator SSK1